LSVSNSTSKASSEIDSPPASYSRQVEPTWYLKAWRKTNSGAFQWNVKNECR
jgi:hypothetical protein